MRILAIRGQNLASLAEPFEIDLGREPLAGTGLFAITGDTGAGKSTILDALCLALYGEYPRTSGGRREKVVDPSGEALEAADPGNILRRGAARGFAEVDFVGGDGHGYRVRWEVRRARGHAAGRLQKSERRLDRLDGSGGIAVGKQDVLDAVIARTGLTFEQFRRTVLLAQGEFDAFLLADSTTRAALLEKITGTEIYSRISKQVFDEAAARRSSLNELERRRGDIQLMEPDAHAALIAGQAEKLAAAAATESERQQIEASLRHGEDVAKAREAIASAVGILARAMAAVEAATADQERLKLLRALDPLRSKGEARRLGFERLKEAQGIRARAIAEHRDAEMAAAGASEALAAAEQAARLCEAEAQRFEPEWARAAALDTEIATAGREVASADKREAEARGADERCRRLGGELRGRAIALQQAFEEAQSRLAGRAGHAPLASGLAEIERLLAAHAQLDGRRSEADNRRRDLEQETKGIAAGLKAFADRREADRIARQRLASDLEIKRAASTSIDAIALSRRDAALQALAGDVDAALGAAARYDESRRREQEATKAALAAAQAREAAADRHAEARRVHGEHSAARDALRQLSDLAEATLSRRAAELRSTLTDGEPCPVCGATEHPYAHDNDAATELANGIRERRRALDEAIAQATSVIVDAQGALADASARRDSAREAAEIANAAAAAATAELAEMVPRIAAAHAELKLAGASALLSNGAVAETALRAIKGEVADARSNLARQLRAAEALRIETDRLQGQLLSAVKAAEDAERSAEHDRGRSAKLNEDAFAVATTLALLGDQHARMLEALAPHLAAAELDAADLARDRASAEFRFRQLALAYLELAADSESLRLARDEADLAARRAEDDAKAACETLAKAHSAAAERRQALSALTERRAGMLGGAATEAHRTKVRDDERVAREQLDKARSLRAEAERLLAVRHAACRAAIEQHEAAIARHADAHAAFHRAIAALGLDDDRAAALLAEPPEQVAALEERIADLDRALWDARHAHDFRRRDLEALTADRPEPDAEALAELRSSRDRHTAALEMLRRELAMIEVRLAEDEKTRQRAGEIDAQIAAARAELEVWDAVDAAIGQKDGAKFRRFAQGVTLGHLVRLATQQLDALNPRYALAVSTVSELALEVVDRDMGDEVRGPRSLSGGERFLVSLALALALSGLEGRRAFVDTLLIDEGFGALDRDTLDMAIAALETLQGHGRKVGVITHVAAMIERIPVQVRVETRGGGRSVVRIDAPNDTDALEGLKPPAATG